MDCRDLEIDYTGGNEYKINRNAAAIGSGDNEIPAITDLYDTASKKIKEADDNGKKIFKENKIRSRGKLYKLSNIMLTGGIHKNTDLELVLIHKDVLNSNNLLTVHIPLVKYSKGQSIKRGAKVFQNLVKNSVTAAGGSNHHINMGEIYNELSSFSDDNIQQISNYYYYTRSVAAAAGSPEKKVHSIVFKKALRVENLEYKNAIKLESEELKDQGGNINLFTDLKSAAPANGLKYSNGVPVISNTQPSIKENILDEYIQVCDEMDDGVAQQQDQHEKIKKKSAKFDISTIKGFYGYILGIFVAMVAGIGLYLLYVCMVGPGVKELSDKITKNRDFPWRKKEGE